MAKRSAQAEAPTRKVEQTVEDVGAQQRSGMVPDQWNAAVRLQCAVRDAIERPIGLVDALDICRDLIADRGALNADDRERLQGWFDEREEEARFDQEMRQKAIAATAGQRR